MQNSALRCFDLRRHGFAYAFWALLCVFLLFPAAAQSEGYLSDQALFDEAWNAFEERAGRALDLMALRLRPDRIEIDARSGKGGARADTWVIAREWGLFGKRNVISGPRPLRPTGPVGDIETAFFPAADLPLARLVQIVADAAARAPLQEPGSVTEVSIARRLGLIPRPSYGDVRWRITIANDREQAIAHASADGTIFGLDISGTVRGRNRNFLTQDDWPFGEAQTGFRNIVGERNIYRIEVRASTITVIATAERNPKEVTRWSWDGGRFTRGLIDLPNSNLRGAWGDLPFALSDVDLALVPKIVAVAQAEAPNGSFHVKRVEAVKERTAAGDPEVLWLVNLSDGSGGTFSSDDDDVQVRARLDGTVASVVLPERLRPPVDFLSGAGLVDAIGRFQAALGAEHRVFELRFQADEVRLTHADAENPNAIATVILSDRGITRGITGRRMMETDADLFPISHLNRLNAEKAERMMADGLAALAISGAEVYRITIWSGGPFQRSKTGLPLVDVRAKAASGDGYVLFLVNGKLIEAVK